MVGVSSPAPSPSKRRPDAGIALERRLHCGRAEVANMRTYALAAVLILTGCNGSIDGGGDVDEALSRKHAPVCGLTWEDARCHAHVIIDAATGEAAANAAPSGYGPADLRSAYAVPASTSASTVAIVDAYDNPNVESDLAVYRAQFGLPACTTANGCFRKVDENGGSSYPRGDTGWGQEIDLDVQMVSAICPSCKILLVEAS